MEASVNGNGAHGRNPCPCRDIDISAETFCAHGWTKIENKIILPILSHIQRINIF